MFYDTGGGQCLAVWDFHDTRDLSPTSTVDQPGLGLPPWTNHLAFDAPTLDDARGPPRPLDRQRLPVIEIDHGWCTSIYAEDPNGITVEFCCTTGDVRDPAAAALLVDPAPPLEMPPEPTFYVPEDVTAGG